MINIISFILSTFTMTVCGNHYLVPRRNLTKQFLHDHRDDHKGGWYFDHYGAPTVLTL